MNPTQKVAFWCGFGLLVIVAVFPPVVFDSGSATRRNKPFHFVLSSAMPAGYPEKHEDPQLTDLVAAFRKTARDADGRVDDETVRLIKGSDEAIIRKLVETTEANGTIEDFPELVRERDHRKAVRDHSPFFDTRTFRILIGDLALRIAIVTLLTGAAVWGLKTPRRDTPPA